MTLTISVHLNRNELDHFFGDVLRQSRKVALLCSPEVTQAEAELPENNNVLGTITSHTPVRFRLIQLCTSWHDHLVIAFQSTALRIERSTFQRSLQAAHTAGPATGPFLRSAICPRARKRLAAGQMRFKSQLGSPGLGSPTPTHPKG
jgi:hypothetical protein